MATGAQLSSAMSIDMAPGAPLSRAMSIDMVPGAQLSRAMSIDMVPGRRRVFAAKNRCLLCSGGMFIDVPLAA